jgi:uncharacterized protein (TIGR00730 family)
MNICVFCGSKDVAPVYREAAHRLGALMGSHGHSLVWGGSNVGLMRDVADAVQNAGGKLYGVSVENFKTSGRENADEMEIAVDLATRKGRLMERADAFVALVGGSGTLDEITDMIEQRKYGKHDKPVVVLNTNGFYDGFKQLIAQMDRDGFLYWPAASHVSPNFALFVPLLFIDIDY